MKTIAELGAQRSSFSLIALPVCINSTDSKKGGQVNLLLIPRNGLQWDRHAYRLLQG